jgi:hypothetical protein
MGTCALLQVGEIRNFFIWPEDLHACVDILFTVDKVKAQQCRHRHPCAGILSQKLLIEIS